MKFHRLAILVCIIAFVVILIIGIVLAVFDKAGVFSLGLGENEWASPYLINGPMVILLAFAFGAVVAFGFWITKPDEKD